jgi:hypothetical protein
MYDLGPITGDSTLAMCILPYIHGRDIVRHTISISKFVVEDGLAK